MAMRPFGNNRLVVTGLFLCVIAFAFGIVWSISDNGSGRRFERTNVQAALLPPTWWVHTDPQRDQVTQLQTKGSWYAWLGTDQLGRDLLARSIVGIVISICVGLFAAFIAVIVGTGWGVIAGMRGGRVDSSMMRIVDILYGLPSIMLVVLITVAANSVVSHSQMTTPILREVVNVVALLAAIGIVSWLTVSRVIRGQVRSLVARPEMEACKVLGIGPIRIFTHHLLPAILGTIIVYATLTVPTAILSEAFLSFLGIGIREPLPSLGNLTADGLSQLNPIHSRWWLSFWPCLWIATILVGVNWFGQSLRRRVNPILSGVNK